MPALFAKGQEKGQVDFMNWYKAYDSLSRHPKTLKLARLLNIRRRETVGLLHDLFSWGIYAADKYGRLRGAEAGDIGTALEYRDGEKLAGALVEAGFLEIDGGDYVIHEWYEYNGALNESLEKRRRQTRERVKKYRDRNTENTDCV